MVQDKVLQDDIPDHEAGSGRTLDPNALQGRASDPQASVWVSASAGTGKTKVLTDRVLRLLLPRADGAPGTRPHKILGITFTKAAAGEMALRISRRLGSWAVMPQEGLQEELHKLLGRIPTGLDISEARKLFADVVDTPGGLKIMTIHSFCQSVLGRFPLEAGLPPYFSVLEDHQAGELLRQAQGTVIRRAGEESGTPRAEAFSHIAGTLNDAQFFTLVKNIIAERRQFEALLRKHFDHDGLYTALCTSLDIRPGQTPEDLVQEACVDHGFDKPGLKKAQDALAASDKKTDQEKADSIALWLDSTAADRPAIIDRYKAAFLTSKGEIRKTLATKSVQDKHPDIAEILYKEAERLLALDDKVKATQCAMLTRDLLILGEAVLEEYRNLKTSGAALDFDDLILKTRDLIKSGAGWVLYKLDQGLDHILVDEAQDTNPDQWAIIEALCNEFFAGQGAGEETRSVFVVGDEKQSIYSFQRASPEEFARMQDDFRRKVEDARQRWEPVDLDISFRSAQSVLQAVDAVFAVPALRKGLSLKDITHHAYRSGEAGRVEIWPLFESAETPAIDLWTPPVEIIENPAGEMRLAEHLASTIEGWIRNREELPARGRAITPGDIMILVRTRTSLVNTIARALKTRGIPVSGSDRMILNEQLVIQDLLALAQFALLPADDLTLACVLKSPLIGLSEEDLFALAHDRQASLWASLKDSEHTDIATYLGDLVKLAGEAHPFTFFSHILQMPCPGDERSGIRALKTRLGDEIIDPVNEFLSAALEFERSHIAALQGFVFWQTHKQDQIKREMEEAGDQVRIMTVHSAKGLQAPIVIMPDTVRTSLAPPGQIDRRLIWPDKSGADVPLFSPRSDEDCQAFKAQMHIQQERMEEEYRRLLYVAMTRAEDRLYVTGYKGAREPLEHSWYNYIKSGLQALPGTQKLDGGVLRLDNPQTRPASSPEPDKNPTSQYDAVPEWLLTNAPEEPDPPKPLAPSRPSQEEPAATSPLGGQAAQRFRRGNVTHKLLEILPGLEPDKREDAARDFVSRFAADLKEDVRADIVKETLQILARPDFAPLFGPASRAEVPVSGYLEDGRLISGQIDRLLVTDDEIQIIDYKTNRPPPENSEDIPALYQSQMQAYADTLRAIYPERRVRAALLWTDGPYLMPVSIKQV